MPVPKPRSTEKKPDFIRRCMSNAIMIKEYKVPQRYAICITEWKNRKKK